MEIAVAHLRVILRNLFRRTTENGDHVRVEGPTYVIKITRHQNAMRLCHHRAELPHEKVGALKFGVGSY